MPDFEVRDEGSLVLFKTCSDTAKPWRTENVQAGPALGQWRAVEHRYAQSILEGIDAEGMTLEQG